MQFEHETPVAALPRVPVGAAEHLGPVVGEALDVIWVHTVLERVTQHGIPQAPLVMGGGQREERRLATGDLEDRRSRHDRILPRGSPLPRPSLVAVDNEEPVRSPRVIDLSWGRMAVEGVGTGKDFKLYPGGGRAWDWSETGTEHSPGIQPADVEELLERGTSTVVLSRGMDLRLDVDPRTLATLKERGVTVHILGTREAVDLYNKLAEDHPVGGLFHSTC